MNFHQPRSILLLGGALFVGGIAGWASRAYPLGARQGNPSSLAPSNVTSKGLRASDSIAIDQTPGESIAVLSNQTEADDFGAFDFQKQVVVLRRLSLKHGDHMPPSAQLLLARAAALLTADQAAALLEGLTDKEAPICTELAKRLAELDPERALELGKTLVPQSRGAILLTQAVTALGEKDAAKALAMLASIPQEQRKGVFEGFINALSSREASVAGALPDVLAVLKANASLIPEGQSWRINRLIGSLLADAALADPAAAIAQATAAAQEIATSVGNRSANRDAGGRDEPGKVLVQGILDVLRERDPAAASSFFDAIPDSQKTSWMLPFEAIARFKSGGVEAAISLAESQTNEEFMKRAASGTWWGLAQKDRGTAMEWIESLPQGPFRQGVLESVRMDAWMQSRSWGSDRTAVEAGASLLSRSSQLDYFTSLMAQRRFGSRSSSNIELISSLPISEADKMEILRRVAPIKSE